MVLLKVDLILRRKDKMDKWINESLIAFEKKYQWVVKKNLGRICYTTDVLGNFDDRSGKEQIGWWTNGFWTGILWQLYSATGEESYRKEAESLEGKFDSIFLNSQTLDHDNGFRWLPNSVAHYKVDKNKSSLNRGLLAAELLAGRFCPTGEFIRAWNEWEGMPADNEDNRHIGWAIIDCMMNLPLLYWASDITEDPRYKDIAMLHADTAMRNFVRADGSVVHICCFDPYTGALRRTLGGQGYADGSSWTRGQAWGLYGFTLSYMHTNKQEYLDTAKRIANYFIANIPENGLIPVDFRQPKDKDYEDSSAATIAACGLIELSRKCENERDSNIYLNAALKMLKALHENRNDYSDRRDNIVTKSTEAYHKEPRETAIIYADYYYLEALLKLVGKELFIW